MKKRAISTVLVALLTLSACAGCGSKSSDQNQNLTSTIASVENSKVPKVIDYLPKDDEYLTDEEFDSISEKYKDHLSDLNEENMSVAVIEDFKKNGDKFKNSSKYNAIKFQYELAASTTGDCDGVTDFESSKLDKVLDLSFKLDKNKSNKSILCDYKNKSGVTIKNIYVTWTPFDENGKEVLCVENNNSSFDLTLKIEGDIDDGDTGKKKFETAWYKYDEIASCKLKYVLIVFEDNIATRFVFKNT